MKSITLSKTINIGNFESISVEISDDKHDSEENKDFVNRMINEIKKTIITVGDLK